MTKDLQWKLPDPLLSFLYIGSRNVRKIVCASAVCAGAAWAIVMALPWSYRADALVLIEPQKVSDKYVNSAVNTDAQDRLASISQQILSNTRLQKIVNDFHLYSDLNRQLFPEEILELMRKKITVKLERGWTHDRPGAFHVGFEGSNPTVVAEVTNRLVNAFLEENLRQREQSAVGTSDFLEAQMQEAKKSLEIQEKNVAEYKQKHEGALPGQEVMLNAILGRLQQELQFVEEAIARDNLNKISIQNTIQAAHSADDLAVRLLTRTQAPPQKEKRSEAITAALESARVQYTAKHPAVKELEAQLVVALAAEAKESAAAKSSAPPPEAPEYLQWQISAKQRDENYKSQIAVLDQDLKNREKHRDELIADIERRQRQLAQLPVRELQMGAITRDYENSLVQYRGLLEKRQNASIATEMEHRQKGENFRIVDPARIPQKPLGLPVWQWALIGAVSGLFIAWATCIAVSYASGEFLGEWELPDYLPVLARIPSIQFEGGQPVPSGLKPSRPKVLRTAAAVALPLAAIAIAAFFYVYRPA